MPSWGELIQEIAERAAAGPFDMDQFRRKAIADLSALTGRSTIIYATNWLGPIGGPGTSIDLGDMRALMEVFYQLPADGLDLILHSPGGSAEAVDRLVRYSREKFSNIRVFVPLAAMSAATMWALSADELVMGRHSQLGPIDPQIMLPTGPNGVGIPVPAGALLDQFATATEDLAANPERITAWLPTLQQYPPGLLNICENASTLARTLVAQWLEDHLLKDHQDPTGAAASVAEWLSDHKVHLSHSRSITRDELIDRGVPVSPLEEDQQLQDAVLTVHHLTQLTLGNSAVVKIVENNLGRAYVEQAQPIMMQPPPGMIIEPPSSPLPGEQGAPVVPTEPGDG